jgi:cell division protein ZapA (FtsZ GTPase activity inhibitor)
MKKKYTITVANSELHIVTEEPKEALDTIVGVVDRRVREIHLHSPSCSRVDAAIILCLEYCAEKLKLKKKLKDANAEIERLAVLNEVAARENAALEREIETLRASLNMSNMPKSAGKRASEFQLGFDDISTANEPLEIITEAAAEEQSAANETAEPIAEPAVVAPIENEKEAVAEEALTPPTDSEDKKTAKAKKKKVRAMFDMISFDDI